MQKINEVVLASRNKKKLLELEDILAPFDIRVRSVLEFDRVPEIAETGTTFCENAALKAEGVARELGGVRFWRMTQGWSSIISGVSRGCTLRDTPGTALRMRVIIVSCCRDLLEWLRKSAQPDSSVRWHFL